MQVCFADDRSISLSELGFESSLFHWVWGGKSGLHMAMQGVTPLHRKVRNSGTERMSGAMSLELGTGDSKGAAGVKAAKLCMEQDQIGRRF